MVTKELLDYIYNHKKMQEQIRFNIKAKNFFSNFSEKTYNDLQHIIKNEKNITESEWESIFNEYKTQVNSPILQALMESDYVSDELHNKMVEFLIKGEYQSRLSDNEQRDHTLLRALTKDNITPKNIAAIVEYTKDRSDDVSNFIYNFKKHIKDDYLKIFISRYVTNKAEARKVNCNDLLRQCLISIKDEAFLKELLDKFPLEKYRTTLMYNEFISDEFKKEIYNDGIDIRKVNHLSKVPKEVFEDIYRSYLEAFFDVDVTAKNYDRAKKSAYSDEERQQLKVYVDAKNKIYDVIVSEQLNPAQEYDLFLRFKSMEMSVQQETLSALLRHTKSEQILRESQELKSPGHRDQVFYNPHIPEDMLNKRIDDITKKAMNSYAKSKEYKMSKKDIEFLMHLIEQRKKVLPKKLYFALMDNVSIWHINRIASTRNVPEEVLDKIIENNKYASDIKDINTRIVAKLNKTLDKKYSNDEFSSLLYEFVRIDSTRNKSYVSNSIGRSYKNDKEVRPFIEEVAKELENIETTTKNEYEKQFANLMKDIVNASFDSMDAFDGHFHKANKDDIHFILHDEMFPTLSHKYFALDFYIEIDKKAQNLKEILNKYDEIEKEEIVEKAIGR